MEQDILVIDNSRLERAYLEELFKEIGYKPFFAQSLCEGFELCREKSFFLILLNRMDINGELKDVIDRLKDLKNTNATLILMEEVLFEDSEKYPLTVKKPLTVEKLGAIFELFMTDEKNIDTYYKPSEKALDQGKDRLDGIEGLDHAEGVKNCGSPEGYDEALKVFYNTIEPKAEEIEKLFNERDIKNYTIKVHALKSASRLVGALELSKKARLLEEAGNEGNIGYIEKNTDELLAKLRDFTRILKPILEKGENEDTRPAIDETELVETFLAIAEYADAMDYDSIEMLLGYLKDYSLPEKEKERYNKLKTLLLEMKWEEISDLCRI